MLGIFRREKKAKLTPAQIVYFLVRESNEMAAVRWEALSKQ